MRPLHDRGTALVLAGSFVLLCVCSLPVAAADNIERLKGNIKSDDVLKRIDAVYAAGNVKDARLVEVLLEALNDSYPVVKKGAARALGRIGDPNSVNGLAAAIATDDVEFRRAVAEALASIPHESTLQPLLSALKDSDISVRLSALRGLQHKGDPEAIDSLCLLLSDDDARVRAGATLALGLIRDAKVVQPLAGALKDGDLAVRKAAVNALGRVNAPQAVPLLAEALREYTDPPLRSKVLAALKDTKDPRAIDSFIFALRDKDPGVRLEAARGLGGFEDLRILGPLTEVLRDDNPNVRCVALRSLYSPPARALLVEHPGHMRPLIAAAMSNLETFPDQDILRFSAAAISTGNAEVIPELIEMLKRKGRAPMAEIYLNCGREELQKAAREWAKTKGIPISSGHPREHRRWGRR